MLQTADAPADGTYRTPDTEPSRKSPLHSDGNGKEITRSTEGAGTKTEVTTARHHIFPQLPMEYYPKLPFSSPCDILCLL